MAQKTAFVTGGTGFVGINLIRELIRQDWQVTALHRPQSDLGDLKPLPISLVVGDILEPESLVAAMPESVDAVFHIAGDTSLWSGLDAMQTRVNVEGTRNVVNAALSQGAQRLIHTSTTSAFGRHDGVVDESTPSNAPHSKVNYEKSKWLAEQEVLKAVKEHGLNAVIMNPAAILGPFDKQTWAQVFFMIRDGKIPALPPGRVSFNHVDEIVRAHIKAVDIGAPGERYILAGDTMVLAEMMRKMGALLGRKVPSVVAPAWALRISGLIQGSIARLTGKEPNISPEQAVFMGKQQLYKWDKAKAELGLQASSLDDCLKDSYDWLMERGLL